MAERGYCRSARPESKFSRYIFVGVKRTEKFRKGSAAMEALYCRWRSFSSSSYSASSLLWSL